MNDFFEKKTVNSLRCSVSRQNRGIRKKIYSNKTGYWYKVVIMEDNKVANEKSKIRNKEQESINTSV